MTTIFEDLDLPNVGGTPTPAEVRIRIAGAQGKPQLAKKISEAGTIIGELLLSTWNGGISSTGYWEADLWPTSDLSPGGLTYLVTRKVGCDVFQTFISVPVTGGPFEASTQEDDPLGEITPSALAGHAGDVTLHGGGIQIDYKFIQTTATVTGSAGGLVLSPLTGTMVTVPDLARPVHLIAHFPAVQPSGGPSEQNWGLFKSDSGFGAFAALDAASPAGLTTADDRAVELFAQLPAHSAGSYVIAGSGASGNFTARVAASAIQKCSLRAMAA